MRKIAYAVNWFKLAAVAMFLFYTGQWARADEADSGKSGGFTFVQMSDTHWGFGDPAINPDFAGTLKKAIAAVNALDPQPDFVIFTGDLTHSTTDADVRAARLREFIQLSKTLKTKDVRYMPGEHDAGLDNGKIFRSVVGETRYAFSHKGVRFIALDNVSDPASSLGAEQLKWLSGELGELDKKSKLVVFSHRPLFDLKAQWDWWTRDGGKALELLKPFNRVAAFYGHIHQLDFHKTGNIVHYGANGLMYALSSPESAQEKIKIPWDAAHPYKGLGFRVVRVDGETGECLVTEYPVAAQAAGDSGYIIKVTAKQFEFSPSVIRLKKDVPVTLELTSLDAAHGFNCPGLGIREDIYFGKTTKVRIEPRKTGVFPFHCDIFCGEGHDDMTGKIIVE